MDYFILFKDQDDEMVERIKSYNANISLSLLFLAMSVAVIVGYGFFLRCAEVENELGKQVFSSVADCSNLVFVTCTTTCGVPIGATCNYVPGGSGFMRIGIPPVSDESTCTYFYSQVESVTFSGGLKMDTLKECYGVLKKTTVCETPLAVVGIIGGYLSVMYSFCGAVYLAFVKCSEGKKDGEEYTEDEAGLDLSVI